MGVKGLWRLLLPIGRRISIETLEGKILAIDASIWLTQFLKAMRDPETGQAMASAHLIGFFRRICRLRYHGIRPVFVFDGATPEIKRRELEQRRRRRDHFSKLGNDDIHRLAKKLLVENMMKKRQGEAKTSLTSTSVNAPSFADGFDPGDQETSQVRSPLASSARSTPEELGVGAGTPFPPSLPAEDPLEAENGNCSEDELQGDHSAWSDEEEVDIAAQLQDADEFDIDLIANLPPSKRKDAVEQAKRRQRMQFRKDFMPAAANPLQFSNVQLSNFLKSAKLNKDIVKAAQRAARDANLRDSTACAVRVELIREPNAVTVKDSNKLEHPRHASKTQREVSSQDEITVPISLARYTEKKRKRVLTIEDSDEEEDSCVADTTTRPTSPSEVHVHSLLDTPDSVQGQVATHHQFGSEGGFVKYGSNNSIEWPTLQLQEQIDSTGKKSKPSRMTQSHVSPVTNVDSSANVDCADTVLEAATDVDEDDDNEEDNGSIAWEEGAGISHKNQIDDRISCQPRSSDAGKVPGEMSSANADGVNTVLATASGSEDEDDNNEDDDDAIAWEEGADASPESDSVKQEVNFQHTESNTYLNLPRDSSPKGQLVMEIVGLQPQLASDNDRRQLHANLYTASEAALTESDGRGGLAKLAALCPINESSRQTIIHDEYTKDTTKDRVEDVRVSEQGRSKRYEEAENKSLTTSPRMELESDDSDKDWDSDQIVSASDDTAAALERGLATATNLTNWAGAAFRRAVRASGQGGSTSLPSSSTPSSAAVVESRRSEVGEMTGSPASKPISHDSLPGSVSRSVDGTASNAPQTLYLDENLATQWDNDRNVRERDMDSITDEMREDVIQLLRLFGVPFLEAPAEAEAQCAALEDLGLVHGIVTEDSDVFVFGGRTVYKNIFDDQKYAEVYKTEDAAREMNLTRNEMVALAMLLGGDYTAGVRGVGIVNAMEVLSAFDTSHDVKAGLAKFKDWLSGDDFFHESKARLESPSMSVFDEKHKGARTRWVAPEGFPSDKVLQAYQNPVVDKSDGRFSWELPDVEGLIRYCQSNIGWSPQETRKLLDPVMENLSSGLRQTRIDSYMKYEDSIKFANIQSKRLRHVLSRSAGDP